MERISLLASFPGTHALQRAQMDLTNLSPLFYSSYDCQRWPHRRYLRSTTSLHAVRIACRSRYAPKLPEIGYTWKDQNLPDQQ